MSLSQWVMPAPFDNLLAAIRSDRGPSAMVPGFEERNGNERAKFLLVLEAPGPKALVSGAVSQYNQDQTAQNLKWQLTKAGITDQEIAIWNVVPWYLGDEAGKKIRAARSPDVLTGREYLKQMIDLIPDLECIVLFGSAARMAHIYLSGVTAVRIVSCHHTSGRVVGTRPWTVDENLAVLRFIRRTAT